MKANLSNDIELIKSLYSSIGFNFTEVQSRIKKIDENKDLVIEINKGNKTKISKITFIGNKNVGSKRLTEIIASEEDKFWKVLTRNTNLSENLIKLDIRLLTNYYKSLGYYDIKVNSNFAEIDDLGNAKIVYSIDEGQNILLKKYQ